jgi:hypothetical protein
MLAHRKNNFQINTPFTSSHYNRLTTARNFVWLTPELGQYMHDEMLPTIEAALAEYEYVEPYWFVSRYEGCLQENTIRTLNDYYALFQARAWILKKSRPELVKYLDVPGYAVGDCFYLHNLISAIEAQTVAPEILPNGGGIYVNPVTVTLAADSTEEDIYYTLDGSEPNDNSTAYTAPFVLGASATVKARAFFEGVGSPTASAVFTIDTGMANAAPQVGAGSDQEITFPDNDVVLDGTVTDTTLPWPPGEVTTSWEKMSGAGTVTFGDTEAVDTTATFSTPGVYVLRLSAYDGDLTGTDDVTITVNQKPNEAPIVDAGHDNAVALPNSFNLERDGHR